MIDDDMLDHMAETAAKAKARQTSCCLQHYECAEFVPLLVAEIRRLRAASTTAEGGTADG